MSKAGNDIPSFIRSSEEVNPEDYIITVNKVRPKKGVDLDYILTLIAAEESTGTESVFLKDEVKYYTTIDETREIRERFGAKVTNVQKTEEEGVWRVDIAYPIENACQMPPNMPMLLTIIIGDHNGLPEVDSCRLEDIHLPEKFLKDYPGPRFGVEGIRKLVGITDSSQPLIGAIIKPNLGNTPEETADICKEMALNGINFIKDDELLVDISVCRLEDKVKSVMRELNKVEAETGRKTLWAVNVTASVDRIKENAKIALDNGANCLMVNFLCTGYDALRMLAEDDSINVPIHTHRCGHDIMTRDLEKGVAMRVIAKLARINGADQVHIGNVGGKNQAQIKDITDSYNALQEPMHNIKKSFGVSSRIVAGEIEYSCKTLGTDLVVVGCGGVHRHPMGRGAGVRSLAQAVNYLTSGIPFSDIKAPEEEFSKAVEI